MDNSIRKQKRQWRKNLSASERNRYSQAIAEAFLASPYYRSAKHIAAYLALPEEVDVMPIIEQAWTDNKNLYLPVVSKKNAAMHFAPFFPDSPLRKDAMGIAAPDISTDHYISARHLDTVVTPLVAFDCRAHRIGMGGGYYDRTFAFVSEKTTAPQLIGVAFEGQKTSSIIETQAWDVPLQGVFTERRFYGSKN